MWRDTLSPRTLLNLIEHLPRDSAFAEAIAQDDERFEGVALTDFQAEAPSIPLTEFGPQQELLAAIYDRLGEVVNVGIQQGGGKPVAIRPWPRPVTAADRAQARARRAAMDDMADVLFPTE